MSDSALILHLQRLSTEDGPGIRTTVFFKGCPLRCAWCHNPESLSNKAQLQWLEDRCINCLTCIDTCSSAYLSMSDSGISIDRECCLACGDCADACPTNALELLGCRVPVHELFQELLKDKVFYEVSGGGVTLSGGEPLIQAASVLSLLRQLTEVGIPTAVDTCGFVPPLTIEKVLPYTALLLFDLKLMDPAKHEHYTGTDNQRILDNLLLVRDLLLHNPDKGLWIRTPLIPGATATEENISRIGQFLAQYMDGTVQRWELCAFNNLCQDKYRRLGLEWSFDDTPLMQDDEIKRLETVAKESGIDPDLVVATGASAVRSEQ